MPRIFDKRVRIFATVVVLLSIGLLLYQVGIGIRANRDYSAANKALERFDYYQANEHLKNYLLVRPTDSTVLLMAAQTARRQKDFEEARRRLGLASKNGAAKEEVDAERRLQSIHAGDLSAAEPMVRYCNDQPDAQESALILEAIIEGGLKSNEISLVKWGADLWLRHRLTDLDQAQGLYWRGRAHLLTEDLPQGVSDLRAALELVPEHYLARVWLAEFLIMDDPRQAAPHLEYLRRNRPGDLTVQLQTARLYRNLGQPEKASPILETILASSLADQVPVLIERGRVAMDLKRPQEAERWLIQARSLAPTRREVNLALADCLRQSGDLVEAKRYQDKVQEFDAKAAELRAREAAVLEEWKLRKGTK